MVGPDEAVEVGYADVVADPDAVTATAQARAAELAKLPVATYAATKRRLRGPASDAVLADLEADLAEAMSGH